MKKHRLLALLVLCALLLSACSAKSMSTADYAGESTPMDPVAGGSTTSGSPSETTTNSGTPQKDGTTAEYPAASLEGQIDPGDRKLIKNGSFTIETLEFDRTITALETLVSASGGYVQSGNVSGTGALDDGYQQPRSASYVIRIPANHFESFTEQIKTCGTITDSSQSVDEVTDYYYDLQARISSLQVQEQRVQTLIGQAGDLETILALEKTLADVRYEIESKQGQLRRLDSQISLSTINVSVSEVFEPVKIQTVPRTLGARISQRFSNTWDNVVNTAEDFFVWLLGDSIMILIWLAVIAGAALVIRTWKRRRDGIPHEKSPHRFFRPKDSPPDGGQNP